MKRPQIVVWESDGRLAHQLAPLAAERRWVLRESRQVGPCVRELRSSASTVFVVRVMPLRSSELQLLARVIGAIPGVRTVAVGDTADSEVLAGMTWDLGVDFALFPPISRELLPDVVAGLMGRS